MDTQSNKMAHQGIPNKIKKGFMMMNLYKFSTSKTLLQRSRSKSDPNPSTNKPAFKLDIQDKVVDKRIELHTPNNTVALPRRSKDFKDSLEQQGWKGGEIDHFVDKRIELHTRSNAIVSLPRRSIDIKESSDEYGRKIAGNGGMGAVAEGRKSVSHVETNLPAVAAFLSVKVLAADMPAFIQIHAFRCARRTFDNLEKFSSKHLAFNLKKEFDKVYGPAWHCIVGSSFGSFVTHSTGCFLYFSMENFYILVFKTKVRKAQFD